MTYGEATDRGRAHLGTRPRVLRNVRSRDDDPRQRVGRRAVTDAGGRVRPCRMHGHGCRPHPEEGPPQPARPACGSDGCEAPEEPRRFTAITLHYTVTGDIPPEPIQRAIDLSREKYCSVWHSLRQDIPFEISFAVSRGL